MVRQTWDISGHYDRSIRRASTSSILVAVGCFVIVLGALFTMSSRARTFNETENEQLSVANDLVQQSAVESVMAQSAEFSSSDVVISGGAEVSAHLNAFSSALLPGQIAAVETAQQLQATGAASRFKQVQAQLAFGEFGPALETAQSSPDKQERSQLLKLVASAQTQAGEFDAALFAIRRIPDADERTQARGQLAIQQASSAGGMSADFDSLIELIQSETAGPWLDVDGAGGTITEYETGVTVNPYGLLARLTKQEYTGRLKAMGINARVADLNDDMARSSDLRLVSLTRLEEEIAKRLADGQPVVETMKQLAGLTQVRFVFVYPDEKEVVIGGTAEGWKYNDNGIPVGVISGSPTLQLDDLVTVLRTFSPGGKGAFGCSINPRKEGLKQLKAYVEQSNARGPLRAGHQVRQWGQQLQKMLGLQDIELYGIPLESRVARVIVEADYRMKLIGIGELDGGPNIPSIFDLLTVQEQKSSRLDALRWMMSMKYDAVLHSPHHDVFELQGSSVFCFPENQLVTAQGDRIQLGKAVGSNQVFADNFTRHYAELAKQDLVFADLQNIFDLALVAALLQHERAGEQMGFDPGVFGRDGAFRPARYESLRTVDSVISHRVYRGEDIVVQVAGGVRADLMSVVQDERVLKVAARLKNFSEQGRSPKLPEGRWWWDAAK